MPDLARRVVAGAVVALVAGAGAIALRHSSTDAAAGEHPAPVAAASTATGPARSANPTPFSTTPPTPLTVVAFGDSVPAAATCACAGYVEQLGTWLQQTTHRTTLVHNDAIGGWTTADVENSLRSGPSRTDLAHADLVIIEIGANDFDYGDVAKPECFEDPTAPCWRAVLADMRTRLLRIVPEIRALDSDPDVRIAIAGYWNVTVDGKVGRALGPDFVTGSDVLTRQVNAAIADAASRTGSTYVDFYAPLKGEDGSRDPTDDLLADGDHPNQSGHTLLTRALITTLEDIGVVASWTVG
jgi:lysophospholipase L1-like esterase